MLMTLIGEMAGLPTPRACCCRKGESENKDSNFGQAEQQIIAYVYKAA
jgi:hypothetical protein